MEQNSNFIKTMKMKTISKNKNFSRKTGFVVFVAVFALSCNVSNEISFEQFKEKAQPLAIQTNNALWQDNDFQTAEKLIDEILVLFSRMSKENQERYESIAAQQYLNLAYIFSEQDRTTEAIDAFEKAVTVYGFIDFWVAKDMLPNISTDERFIALIESIRERVTGNDARELLRGSGEFISGSDTTGFPRFTYQAATNRNLRTVREHFNLDSIAGQGDDVSQIINLLAWVSQITHSGSNFALSEFTSIDLYNYYRATGKGLNCRHLAFILNEFYLAMGFKSTYVSCFPKYFISGLHVINSVFSPSLDKWLFMDPSFNAYVKDENGVLLSIEEVRERLIDGRPLVLNETANWNGRRTFKEWYLYVFTAENFYWFERPVDSRFNSESRFRDTGQTHVALIPQGHRIDYFLIETNPVVITHDATYFWER